MSYLKPVVPYGFREDARSARPGLLMIDAVESTQSRLPDPTKEFVNDGDTS